MTKQEEIRDGIEKIMLATYHAGSIGTSISDVLEVSTEELLKGLNSQGVVIKVDRELPVNPYQEGHWKHRFYQEVLDDMAGYVSVEPLIKE